MEVFGKATVNGITFVTSKVERAKKYSLVMIRHSGGDLPEFGRVARFVLHRPPGTQEMHESQVKLEHIFRAEWLHVVKLSTWGCMILHWTRIGGGW